MLVTNQTAQDYWFGPLHLLAGVGQPLTVDDTTADSLYLKDDAVADSINTLYATGKITVSGAAAPFPRPVGVPEVLHGDGSPEGLMYAGQGSLYLRRDVATIYQKTTGIHVNTGWMVYQLSGWTPITVTLTYSSADGHTYVVNTAGDLSGIISPGVRILLTDSGTSRYFIVTAISSTTMTMYGGQNYALSGGTITNPYYSQAKAPLGFPLDPTGWMEKLSDTGARQQLNPTPGTWYNIGGLSLAIPIGAWFVDYEVNFDFWASSAQNIEVAITLSTNSSGESDLEFTAWPFGLSIQELIDAVAKRKPLTLTAKTTYYLNAKALVTMAGMAFNGGSDPWSPTIIRAVSAYL